MAHWYAQDGQTAYTVIDAKGKERDTTLRDARKHLYVPSVTTIMALEASPALVQYKINQVLDAIEQYPPGHAAINSENWRRMVKAEAGQHAKNAANKGTAIHNALEYYYMNLGIEPEMRDICVPVIELLDREFPGVEWIPESSFCSSLGFGGKIDMHSKCGIVLDFKTKDTDDINKMKAYDAHHMQTAAYANGLEMPDAKRYNLFISTREPGLLQLTESLDYKREWGMFEALLRFWQMKNKYYPGGGV